MTASLRSIRLLPLVAIVALALLAGCKKKEEAPPPAPPPPAAPAMATSTPPPAASTAPFTVTALSLGNAVGADQKVATEMDTFAKKDTIYAAVGSTGASSGAKLTAKWSFVSKSGAEKPVKEDSVTIQPTGDAWTDFHIEKPDGWPAGDYKIELLVDGKSVATKAFRVGK